MSVIKNENRDTNSKTKAQQEYERLIKLKRQNDEEYRTLSIIATDSFIERIDKFRGKDSRSAFIKKSIDEKIKRLEGRLNKQKLKGNSK